MEKKFKSSVSIGLLIVIALSLLIPLVFLLINNVWPGVAIIAITSLLPVSVYTNTKYEIAGSKLKIVCGFLYRNEFDITKITSVTRTRNPISSPALSLDRLEIKLGRFDSVLVSPAEKEAFLQALLQINPTIEIK